MTPKTGSIEPHIDNQVKYLFSVLPIQSLVDLQVWGGLQNAQNNCTDSFGHVLAELNVPDIRQVKLAYIGALLGTRMSLCTSLPQANSKKLQKEIITLDDEVHAG